MTQPGALLFGGAFNPPHRSHRRLLETAMDRLPVDAAIVLPTGRHPLKASGSLAPDAARLELCELAFGDLPNVTVSDLDMTGAGPAYTVDTLRTVQAQLPDHRLFWLIGADNLRILDQWHDHHRLLELATLVVVPRRDHPIERRNLEGLDLAPSEIETLLAHVLDVPADDVSATAIRAALRRGDHPPELSPAVLERILALGLYRD